MYMYMNMKAIVWHCLCSYPWGAQHTPQPIDQYFYRVQSTH